MKEKSQGRAAQAQAGAFRVLATLQYLGEGIPGPAEDSMAFGETACERVPPLPELQLTAQQRVLAGEGSAVGLAASLGPNPIPQTLGV